MAASASVTCREMEESDVTRSIEDVEEGVLGLDGFSVWAVALKLALTAKRMMDKKTAERTTRYLNFILVSSTHRTAPAPGPKQSKYPPAEPEALRSLGPQRGLFATVESKSKNNSKSTESKARAYSRNCQTSTASPAEPGGLPIGLENSRSALNVLSELAHTHRQLLKFDCSEPAIRCHLEIRQVPGIEIPIGLGNPRVERHRI